MTYLTLAPPLVTGPTSDADLAVQMSANDMDMESDGWSSENNTPLPPVPESEIGGSWSGSGGQRESSFRRQSPDRNRDALMPAWPVVEAAGFASGRASAEKQSAEIRSEMRSEMRGGLLSDHAAAPGTFGAGEPARAFRSVASAQRSAVLKTLRGTATDQSSSRLRRSLSLSKEGRGLWDSSLQSLDLAHLSLQPMQQSDPRAAPL